MNQKLTFTAFLQDEYSKNFDKLAGRTGADIKSIEKDLTKLGKTGKLLSRSLDDVNKRIDTLTKVRRMTIDTKAIKFATAEIQKLKAERDKLEGMGSGRSGGGGSSVFNIAGGVGLAQIGSSLFSSAKSFVMDAAQQYMQFEMQKKSFGVLTGSDKAGEKLTQQLFKMKQETLMGTGVYKAAQTMLAFGVDNDKVISSLKQLGDISMGDADRLQSLTLAFSQTRSAGKLMGQDLLQYVNAGFNPLTVMVERWKEFGFSSQRSMGQLRKDMEKGTISADMVAKAFTLATSEGGKFYNMTEIIKQTSFGKQKMLEGQFAALKIDFGERFKSDIDATIGKLSSLVGIVKKWVEVPVSEKLRNEAYHLRILQGELNATNTSEDRRKQIIQELDKHYSIHLKNLSDEKKAYADLNTEIEKTVTSLMNKSKVERMKEVMKDIDDRITDQIEFSTTLYMRGITSAEKLLGDAAVAKVTSRTDLSDSQQVELLRKMASDAGNNRGNSRNYVDLADAANQLPQYRTGIELSSKKRTEQQKKVEAAMKQYGIIDENNTPAPGGNGGKGTGGSGSAGTDVPSISGGQKITNLVINIDALIKGGMTFQTTTLKESTGRIKDAVTETLLTAVNDANLAVGN
jgi:tape measure domain-containing protein